MTPEEISQLAFLLYPHIIRSKPDTNSTESLAQRIKGLQEGLQSEDEFAATVAWLGNCAAIHRIDKTPMPVPVPTETMRAPDFIAFPVICGRPLPVLIEVKSHNGDHLDWSEKYLNSLRKFAECLNLPLLVAWKCGALWILVDHTHFEKNVTAYRLQLKTAIIQDLYCVLFRNLLCIRYYSECVAKLPSRPRQSDGRPCEVKFDGRSLPSTVFRSPDLLAGISNAT